MTGNLLKCAGFQMDLPPDPSAYPELAEAGPGRG